MVSESVQEEDLSASYQLALSKLSASPRLSLKRGTQTNNVAQDRQLSA